MLCEKIAIEERGILRASIRVMDAARRWLSPFDCRLKCRGHTTSNCRFLKHAYLRFFVQQGIWTMRVSAAQVRAARGLLDISQQDLADLSKVSVRTIVQFERGSKPASDSILQVLKLSLEAAGIEFIPENGGGPGVRLSRNQ